MCIRDSIERADASQHNFGIVVRTPLVPGINDADEDIAKLAGIVKRLKKLRFMEFLAYHSLGTETYKRLEIPYPLKEIQTPGREYICLLYTSDCLCLGIQAVNTGLFFGYCLAWYSSGDHVVNC